MFWDFFRPLDCSAMLWWVLSGSEKVAESCEVFLDFLGCFGMFWGCPRLSHCSERFWNVPERSEMFSGYLGCCCVPRCCYGLYILWKVFEFSEAFSWVLIHLKGSYKFWDVLWGVLQRLLHLATFLWVLSVSERFHYVLKCSWFSKKYQRHFGAFSFV